MFSIEGTKDIFGLTLLHLFVNKFHHPFDSFISPSLNPKSLLVFDDDPSYFLYHIRILDNFL